MSTTTIPLPQAPHRYQMLIDGHWLESADGRRFGHESPAHDLDVGSYPLAGAADADAAVAAAPASFDELPFGGYGQSGLGRELGRHAVEDFTEVKTMQIHRGPRTSWWHRPAIGE